MHNKKQYDKTYTYSASHATYYPGASNMSIKVLWDKNTLRLIGAQIVGFEGVDKRMDVLSAAVRFGAKVTDLTDLELCYAPPFGTAKDVVNQVALVACNLLQKTFRQVRVDEVRGLVESEAYIIDVREENEYARGHIKTAKNIPLSQIRQRLDEIPKNQPVYLHCRSSQRSYNAVLALQVQFWEV